MGRSVSLLLLVLAAGGGWLALQRADQFSLNGVRIGHRQTGPDATTAATWKPAGTAAGGDTIRLASFNIQVFGARKLEDPLVMERLVKIVSQYDLVAIQEIRAQHTDLLPQFIQELNRSGRQYAYLISRPLGRTAYKEQYAFVFDQSKLEVDPRSVFVVNDPDDLLHRPPLVGWFRTKGPRPEQAFTFKVINVHVDPDLVAQEVGLLDDIYRLVRDDGQGEDDVLLVGDLNADPTRFSQLLSLPGLAWAIEDRPTNTRGTSQYDNILFQAAATSEFTGRAGVDDFLRRYNLSLDEALKISDHLPVWAEFSVYEGGAPAANTQ